MQCGSLRRAKMPTRGRRPTASRVSSLPAGLVLDEVARQRLERQLDRASPHIAGVVAAIGPLAAGASYRVCAEWRSLEPPDHAIELPSTSARGAVLLRPGVEFEVTRPGRRGRPRRLLLDPGAHVHDPWQPIEEQRVALGARAFAVPAPPDRGVRRHPEGREARRLGAPACQPPVSVATSRPASRCRSSRTGSI